MNYRDRVEFLAYVRRLERELMEWKGICSGAHRIDLRDGFDEECLGRVFRELEKSDDCDPSMCSPYCSPFCAPPLPR